jgi:CHAT domain-containing protein
VPVPPAHPTADMIAAHAERRLSGVEAARMDEHLASCSECYETFAETARFVLDEEEPVAPRQAKILAFVRRPAFRIAASLAVATLLLAAFQQLWGPRLQRPAEPLVAGLAKALGETRFIEPRLTGGFQHGRHVVLRAGGSDRPQGLDAYSPAVLAAVARIRERTQGDTSPQALAALAATYLVSGDVAQAVKALESATAQDPKNPNLQSDLAAAYLVRASRLDEPADIPKALEAAETAIAIEGAPPEAWFNRALALEQLHLVDSAKKAWEDFLERDSTSPWADEARKHIEELPPAQKSTIEEDRERARKALAEGPAAINALADEEPSILADYFLAELLPSWADAYLTGHPNAATLRTHAEHVGEALFRTTGDALPRDAARALSTPPSGPSRDPPRLQAQGLKALHEAQRLYDLQQPSCAAFRQSRQLLESGGSPFAAWSSERIVAACLYLADSAAALKAIYQVESQTPPRHVRLLARVRWMQGLIHGRRGELTTALDRYRLARDAFRTARDAQGESKALALVAEGLLFLGDDRAAWRERVRGLALLDQVRDTFQRQGVLSATAIASLGSDLPRTALHAETAALDAARRAGTPTSVSDALIWRGGIQDALDSPDEAAADLVEARRWISRINEPLLAGRLTAAADAAEGRVLAAREPARAVPMLERAIESHGRTTPTLLPGLHLLLARAQRARGWNDAAEAQLVQGIRLLEEQRVVQQRPELQTSFFQQTAALFDEMVSLQLDARQDPQRALSFVERGRGRQLVGSVRSLASQEGQARRRPTGDAVPRTLDELRQHMPSALALVYFATLSERLLSWVVTRDDLLFHSQRLARADLLRWIAAHEAAIETRASTETVRETGGRLFDALMRPLLSSLPRQGTLVLIPDGPLQAIPFSGLWDREAARFLVEDHLVGIAPSGTVFAEASAAAARRRLGEAPRLLAVGNPRTDRTNATGLPSLPGAEAEAAEVAALYAATDVLTRRAATRRAFLTALSRSQVVHIASHAVAGRVGGTSRLLLAPDPHAGDSGILYEGEIADAGVSRTRVVVLAACRTASGSESRLEGTLGVARAFLAAGVPSVVASLVDVDDALSRRFAVTFHRSLLEGSDPALALHEAQVSFLGSADPLLAHPASWAGFVVLGGMDLAAVTRRAKTGGGP